MSNHSLPCLPVPQMRSQFASCLVYFSFCSSQFGFGVSGECLHDQKSFLLALKNDLNFDTSLSTKLVGWNQSTDCCAWGGVECDEAGHVIRLDLSNESIGGGINSSSSLFSLTFLQSLNFYQNKLTGPIPSHWEALNRLELLDLGYNSFTGVLPKSLLTLSSLQYLRLAHNRLSGEIGKQVYFSLRELDLSNNMFHGPIPEFIFKAAGLSTLGLAANNFTGRLDLDMFGELKELYSLDLSYNQLMVKVNTNSNRSAFSSLSRLNTLKLASCKMHVIPDLKNQSRLMMLDLADNQLSGAIPNWVWEVGNGYLRFLNLSHNAFTSLQKPYTFPFLLDVLDLHSNHLKGEIPIPPRRVYHLDYSSNSFGTSIPVGFGNVLTSTFYFSMSNSELVGVIPESIRNATALQLLDLSRNALRGPIPSIGNLKALKSLDLSVNTLSGSIPEQLASLTSLTFLNLSYNHLSGKIPQFQNFTDLSFEGNEGLCGPPLKKRCENSH